MTEAEYSKAPSEEAAPEARSTINKARTSWGIHAFVVDLGDDSCVEGWEAFGSDKGAVVRVCFHRFCT